MGLWPIAGITTVGVTKDAARETIRAAVEAGVTTFDTAYSYGYDGESDRLLGEFVRAERDRFTVMGKVGQRWTPDRRRVVDGSSRQLIADAEESLARMKLDQFDLLYLHSPDPNVPLEESAAAMESLRARGLCRQLGVCNVSPPQLDQLASRMDLHAIQCPLNLVQTDSIATLIDPCRSVGRSVYTYWALMKGLLAGKISRDHVFAEGDSRPGYAIYQGQPRQAIHDMLDQLSLIARQFGQSVAQLAVGWVISQPGVTGALVGARRPEQIRELAGARPMDAELLAAVNRVADPTRRRVEDALP
ncbi:aldo/keto reductase [Roseiconus nitratireducens]|uniref:Aldo/keto reductase n=2 Tax=Roseiconus nitratireducens TaxID=2605748 RepID=A0A5M6D515_9BACT|nr:aldo/keto reductase [Roseiconus nitratireducens]